MATAALVPKIGPADSDNLGMEHALGAVRRTVCDDAPLFRAGSASDRSLDPA